MEIKGIITKVLEKETGTSKAGKEWVKQNFVIDTGDQYNPEVCLQLFGDKTKLLEKYPVGSEVSCGINISSREYNGKYFHNIDCWKISGENQQPNSNNGEEDDLPF